MATILPADTASSTDWAAAVTAQLPFATCVLDATGSRLLWSSLSAPGVSATGAWQPLSEEEACLMHILGGNADTLSEALQHAAQGQQWQSTIPGHQPGALDNAEPLSDACLEGVPAFPTTASFVAAGVMLIDDCNGRSLAQSEVMAAAEQPVLTHLACPSSTAPCVPGHHSASCTAAQACSWTMVDISRPPGNDPAQFLAAAQQASSSRAFPSLSPACQTLAVSGEHADSSPHTSITVGASRNRTSQPVPLSCASPAQLPATPPRFTGQGSFTRGLRRGSLELPSTAQRGLRQHPHLAHTSKTVAMLEHLAITRHCRGSLDTSSQAAMSTLRRASETESDRGLPQNSCSNSLDDAGSLAAYPAGSRAMSPPFTCRSASWLSPDSSAPPMAHCRTSSCIDTDRSLAVGRVGMLSGWSRGARSQLPGVRPGDRVFGPHSAASTGRSEAGVHQEDAPVNVKEAVPRTLPEDMSVRLVVPETAGHAHAGHTGVRAGAGKPGVAHAMSAPEGMRGAWHSQWAPALPGAHPLCQTLSAVPGAAVQTAFGVQAAAPGTLPGDQPLAGKGRAGAAEPRPAGPGQAGLPRAGSVMSGGSRVAGAAISWLRGITSCRSLLRSCFACSRAAGDSEVYPAAMPGSLSDHAAGQCSGCTGLGPCTGLTASQGRGEVGTVLAAGSGKARGAACGVDWAAGQSALGSRSAQVEAGGGRACSTRLQACASGAMPGTSTGLLDTLQGLGMGLTAAQHAGPACLFTGESTQWEPAPPSSPQVHPRLGTACPSTPSLTQLRGQEVAAAPASGALAASTAGSGGPLASSLSGLVLAAQPGIRSVQVTVKPMAHPHTGQAVLLVVQQDVSEAAVMEGLLAELAESQLATTAAIFPKHVVETLTTHGAHLSPAQMASLARHHQDVTLLFMDIVGFTTMSKQVAPEQVMAFLNTLFSVFDQLTTLHSVMKVETAGDCYIVAGGILGPPADAEADQQGYTEVLAQHNRAESAARVMAFAKHMMAASRLMVMPNGDPVNIRIGLHTGNAVSGLIGQRVPKFAVFGDTMNTASRMESTCTPGRIQVSDATAALLPDEPWQATGGIEVKGKGVMETFLWQGELPSLPQEVQLPDAALAQCTGGTSSPPPAGSAAAASDLAAEPAAAPDVLPAADEVSAGRPLPSPACPATPNPSPAPGLAHTLGLAAHALEHLQGSPDSRPASQPLHRLPTHTPPRQALQPSPARRARRASLGSCGDGEGSAPAADAAHEMDRMMLTLPSSLWPI